MKILVIGSGGREHALCWKLKQSKLLSQLYCAPGNAGIADIADCVAIPADDITALREFALKERIDLTVVGPEAPLVAGIVDQFTAAKLAIFGPTKAAAQLEGSKAFAKQFMKDHGIPTAKFDVFSDYQQAVKALRKYQYPLVIKASGLAAGKGVLICPNRDVAGEALQDILINRTFGEAGSNVVIEEYLQGEEVSILAITDGENYICLPSAQDYKRLLDGDQGPNTGGMGAYAPARIITPALQTRIEAEILRPTLEGMRKQGTPYRGCLYLGLMICSDGPKLLEYNCRFGDPETQAVLPLLRSDLLPLLLAAQRGDITKARLEVWTAASVCVVLAAQGYPGKYAKGKPISGLGFVSDKINVFHAGTTLKGDQVVTSGGRVLGITATSYNLRSALKLAYQGVETIDFEGKTFRKDIAQRAIKAVANPLIKRSRGRPRLLF